MLQITGTIIILAQALRGQLKIDHNVSINEKGHLDISGILSIGILALIGGLITQAVGLLDLFVC